jgi:hypothetical protein
MVCSILREQGSSNERRSWAAAALRLLERCFPERPGDLRNWPASSELLPHALTTIEQSQALGIESVPTALLLIRIAAYWRVRAQLQQARRTSQRAVAILESTVGGNDLHVAPALTELAASERELGALPKARTMAERALILQPHLLFAAVVVCAPGTGLMASTPPGPGQHEARPDRSGPHQRHQQPADLGHRQGHQAEPAVQAAVSPFVRSGLVAWARVTAKNAWASRARVMWRYQPGHLRTS